VLYLLISIRQDRFSCNSALEPVLFTSFSCRYGFLLPRVLSDHDDVLSICVAVFEHFSMASEMYQIGITKLFFRAGQVFPRHSVTSHDDFLNVNVDIILSVHSAKI